MALIEFSLSPVSQQLNATITTHVPINILVADELEAGECRIGDCRLNFSDLDEVFAYPGPLVIKTPLDVLPANGTS